MWMKEYSTKQGQRRGILVDQKFSYIHEEVTQSKRPGESMV